MLKIGLFLFFLLLLLLTIFYAAYSIRKGKFINFAHEDTSIEKNKIQFLFWIFYIVLVCLFFVFCLFRIATM